MTKLPQFAAAAAAVSFAFAAVANEAQQQSSQGASQSSSSYSQDASAGASAQHDAEKVRKVQEQLSDKGHDVSADGIWGPETEQALKDFQQAQGMEATGELNQQTLSALGVDEAQAGAGAATGAGGTAESGQDSGASAGGTVGSDASTTGR